MQKNNFLLISSIIFLLSSPATALAVATTSPSPTAPAVNQVTENLKERLKETLSATSPGEKPAASPTYRAFVGQIQDVIQKTIIVETKDGKRQVVLDDDTTLLRNPGNTVIKADSIRLEDYIIAMGTLKEDDVLTGRRLIISATPLTDTTKKTGYGQITEIGKSTLTITSSGEELILDIDKSTIIKSKDSATLEMEDLTLNQRVIFTAEIDDETTTATVLMLIK
jgi:hypothetical protein